MRPQTLLWASVIGLVGLVGCSGDPPPPRPDPEICDDEIDNDGDGAIDCDDDECGGLPCQQQGDDDDTDTGPTGPPPEVEVLFDPDLCCDFDFEVTPNCQGAIGTVSFINRTSDQAGDFDLSCDQIGGGTFPINWQLDGGGNPQPFLTNRAIDPEEQLEATAVFMCNANQTFTVDCNAKIEAGPYEDELVFTITGTLAQ